MFRLADERTQASLPTVIACGVQFGNGDPWAQLISAMGLNCDQDEFLGALNAAGEARGTRALVIIDALNESGDPTLWQTQLAGMQETVQQYPFLALCVSLRKDFVEVSLPQPSETAEQMPRITATGFAGHETQAAAKIFRHFEVPAPAIPLLVPEFANPLFLVTMAEAISRTGISTIPADLSLRWVFDLWLTGINTTLARRLDYDPTEARVQKAVLQLAAAMVEEGRKWLSEEHGKAILSAVHPETAWSRSLVQALLSEGVIERSPTYSRDNASGTYVPQLCFRFTFDRFTDHIIARSVMGRHPSAAALKAVCHHTNTADDDSEDACGLELDPGLLRALAIELPEDTRFGCELYTIIDAPDSTRRVHQAMLESLHWRSPRSIGPELVGWVRDRWRERRSARARVQRDWLARMVELSLRPGHPLNADFLHSELGSVAMADRDYSWSRLLTLEVEGDDAVHRLIDWCRADPVTGMDSESARLALTVLAWIFATSNRFLRDRATKASVALLEQHPRLAAAWLLRFGDVEDVYVVERVLAACYGFATRTSDKGSLRELATAVRRRVQEGKIPVHLAARDYARGIVEFAADHHVLPAQRLKLMTWPRSAWPASTSTLADWRHLTDGDWKSNQGLRDIYRSVFDGDFGTYVIGGSCDWLRYRLVDPIPADLFRSDDARESEVAEDARAGDTEPVIPESSYAHPDEPVPSIPAIHRWSERIQLEHWARFPNEQLRCMILDEIVRMGYTSRLDEDVHSSGGDRGYVGRMGTKSERMGKKYQWLAYSATLARISDHFRFSGERSIVRDTRYDGAWQVSGVRDIDPTCLLRSTAGRDSGDPPVWWAPFKRDDLERPCDDLIWLKDTTCTLPVEEVCSVIDPATGRRWNIGWSLVSRYSERSSEALRSGTRRRHLWYRVVSVLVRSTDAARLLTWLQTKRLEPGNNGHELLPAIPSFHRPFLREFPRGAAWRAENEPYFGRSGWEDDSRSGRPVDSAILADGYIRDGETDASRDDVIEFVLPSAELVEELGLRHGIKDGEFVDHSGELVAWDPSVSLAGPQTLLLDPASMDRLLKRRRYRLVTFAYGERTATHEGPGPTNYLGRLMFSGVYWCERRDWRGVSSARFEPAR